MKNEDYVLQNQSVVGTCSLCRGPVVVPQCYGSVVPPTPTCAKCGAVKIEADHGPVIPMRPPIHIEIGEYLGALAPISLSWININDDAWRITSDALAQRMPR